MTRDDLFDSVRAYADRADLSSDILLALLRPLESELNRALATHPRSYVTATFLLASGQTLLPLPVDMFRLSTLRKPATLIWTLYPQDTPLSELPVGGYIDRGTALELPAPYETEETFILDYYASVCNLATSNAENWVSRHYPDIYLYGMLRELAVWSRDNEHLGPWTDQFMQRLQETVGQGWDQNVGAAPRTRR